MLKLNFQNLCFPKKHNIAPKHNVVEENEQKYFKILQKKDLNYFRSNGIWYSKF